MDRDPYSDCNDHIRKRRDGLSERRVENMIKKEIAKNKLKIGWLKALIIFLLIYSLVMSHSVVKNMTRITEIINKNGQVESSTISIKNSSVSAENVVARKSLDSVVGITTVGVRENMFFQGRVVEGIGSGVVVSKDGYILTNAHAVQDGKAEKIDALLTNGKKPSVKLLWYDTTLDFAVIKTDLTRLEPVKTGNSDRVQTGGKAIAIGNPLGLDLQSTLTSEYISGKDRTIILQNGLQMDGLMRTDAAINSGNSGGGLFDQGGKLIGINTAKVPAEGTGLTIPISVTKSIVDNITTGGSSEGVKLGISGVDARTFQQAIGQKLSINKGIYVVEVVKGSSVQKAGVIRGDIITKVNGRQINAMSSLKKVSLEVRPKQKGKIIVYRDGGTKDLDIEFGTLEQK